MADSQQHQSEVGSRSFTVFLQRLAKGAAHAELTEELHELLSTLHAHADAKGINGTAKGKLLIEVEFEMHANRTFKAEYDVTTKKPRPMRPSDGLWLNPDDNYSFEPPKPSDGPLFRDVAKDVAREVAPEPVAPARSV